MNIPTDWDLSRSAFLWRYGGRYGYTMSLPVRSESIGGYNETAHTKGAPKAEKIVLWNSFREKTFVLQKV